MDTMNTYGAKILRSISERDIGGIGFLRIHEALV